MDTHNEFVNYNKGTIPIGNKTTESLGKNQSDLSNT